MAGAEGWDSTRGANCIFITFLSFSTIVLNIVTIQAIRKTSSLQKPLKTLLLSLAVSDLGVGLLAQPTYIAVLVMQIEQNTNSGAYFLVTILYFIQMGIFSNVSFFGVVAMTVDRFLAIHLHLRYQELVTHKCVVAVVISTWVLSAFFALFPWNMFQERLASVIVAAIQAFCFIITGLLYCKIYAVVRRHENQIHALQVQQAAVQNGEMANAARLRRTAVGTFYVYIVFLVCYLPFFCVNLVFVIRGETTLLLHLSSYALTFVFLNSFLNPLIYFWKMRHIRRAVLEMFRNTFPCGQ